MAGHEDASQVTVIFDLPSRLPALLESGQADAVLVSSIDALRVPGRRMAAGVCIGSDGPVKSVRLFSKVPFNQIQTLALDAASMTSNRLARILLVEIHNTYPAIITREPSLPEMLKEADACVLIGDIGMTSDGTGLHVTDMGEAWTDLTGKPFVWAAWIGNDRLTPELAGHLQAPLALYNSRHPERSEERTESKDPDFQLRTTAAVLREISGQGRDPSALGAQSSPSAQDDAFDEIEQRRKRAVELGATHSGWTRDMVQDYYDNVMVYTMDDRMLDGLREFQTRLLKNGFDDCAHFPALVAPSFPFPSRNTPNRDGVSDA